MSYNIYALPPRAGNQPHPTVPKTNAFDDLTDRIVMARAKAGTLDPAVVEALLAAIREPGRECGR